MIVSFYHLFLDGDAPWKPIVREYARALSDSQFPVAPSVGVIGRDRKSALAQLGQHGWPVVAQADAGWEQVTLAVLQGNLGKLPDDAAVLYAHSKGAWRNIPLEDQWRRSMLWHLVFGWRHCLELLETHDAVGCHWQGTFFAGNCWWAQAGFLKTLPVLAPAITEEERGGAELWLGKGNPRVANLVEGFPPAGTEEGAQQLGPGWWEHYKPTPAAEADIAGEPGFRAPGVHNLGKLQPEPPRPPRDNEYRFPGISSIP